MILKFTEKYDKVLAELYNLKDKLVGRFALNAIRGKYFDFFFTFEYFFSFSIESRKYKNDLKRRMTQKKAN